MPIYGAPQFDPANVASKLPEPFRKPAGAALQGLKDLFGGDTADVSQIAPTPLAATNVPLWKLSNLLKSGFARDKISKAKSPILKQIYRPDTSGSSELASRLMGYQPRRSPKGLEPPIRMAERENLRQAREELYGISQQALRELGIQPEEAINLYRQGPIAKSKWALQPTHVDPDIIESWDPMHRFHQFEVPSKNVEALAGLLRQGDDLTLGEMLVPTKSLLAGRVPNTPVGSRVDPYEITDVARRIIPSWAKRIRQ